MKQDESPFGAKHAANYDKQWAKLAPLRDALHLLIGAAFCDLPSNARVLCVGAGTGTEILYLAERFPQWHFAAVEPSAPMLDVFRERAEAHGIASRCVFHEGYIDSLPSSEPFHAATALLVSQFVLDPEARVDFFRAIAARLGPGGYLASADLSADLRSADYPRLLEIWVRVMQGAEVSAVMIERIRNAYGREVAVAPEEDVSAIIRSAGFHRPIRFFQAGLIHAWFAKRT